MSIHMIITAKFVQKWENMLFTFVIVKIYLMVRLAIRVDLPTS